LSHSIYFQYYQPLTYPEHTRKLMDVREKLNSITYVIVVMEYLSGIVIFSAFF